MSSESSETAFTPENLKRIRSLRDRVAAGSTLSAEETEWLRPFLEKTDPEELDLLLNSDFIESLGQMLRGEGRRVNPGELTDS